MKIIVKNIATNYQQEGKGSDILMLHGWGDNLNTFNSLTRNLAQKHRVTRVDLPGFGETETPEKDWNLDNYVSFIQKFVEKIEIEPELLIGHSFGGRVIIKGIAENKLKAEKIVLISSAGIYKSDKLKNKIIRGVAKTGKVITSVIPGKDKIREYFYKSINSDFYDAGEMKGTFVNIIKEDLQSSAKKINQPTLLIWGEIDDVTPVSDGELLNELIPNSELKIIENSGHFVHQDEAEKVTKLINEFYGK